MNLPAAKIIPFPRAAETERRWRQSCCDFLHAALNGASGKTLRKLADEMFDWRKKMLGPVPQGVPTGDPRPAIGSSK